MAQIILVSGGSRSGKSEFAQTMSEKTFGTRLFVATSPVTDEEMAQRIQKHREQRDVALWQTVEEQINLVSILQENREREVILIDCLTLWINNLMYAGQCKSQLVDEAVISKEIGKVLFSARTCTGKIIFVTNEVGLGIVPDNREARLFRDLVGRCNQHVGAQADEVYLVSCGIPLQLK